ncbi:hypothetical protein ACJJJB_01730 [Microbulbifer sp. ANSA001]|uniref:hypothetical protein n=1 Tax=Microbulbifer sp. ANSA001 TaxID=3243358 RepID=UPI0040427FA2
MNLKKTLGALLLASAAHFVSADSTNVRGKIIFTEGHHSPNCRTVQLESKSTGELLAFRIQDDEGSDDIQSIVLAALMGNREVMITYDPEITSGCGTNPRILYVRIY